MINDPNQWVVRLSEFLPATLPSLQPGTTQQTGQEVMASAGQALGYMASVAKDIFTAIVVLVLAFYWTLDGPRTIQSFLLLLPKNRRESIGELISAMESKDGISTRTASAKNSDKDQNRYIATHTSIPFNNYFDPHQFDDINSGTMPPRSLLKACPIS